MELHRHRNRFAKVTNSSAIAEKPHCRVSQSWPKVEDDILQTIYVYLQSLWRNRPAKLSNSVK